jgi:hypothetical protein
MILAGAGAYFSLASALGLREWKEWRQRRKKSASVGPEASDSLA